MVFDTAAPIQRRKGQPNQTYSLESAMAEEAREVAALISARDERERQAALANASVARDLTPNLYDFSTGTNSSSGHRLSSGAASQRMFMSRKGSDNRSSRSSFSSAHRAVSPSALSSRSSRKSASPTRASDPLQMKGMHRKLTDSAMASSGGLLATLAPSAKMRENQEKERVEKDHDPEAAIESDSSDEQTEEEDDDDKPSPVHAVKSSFVPSRPPMSLAAAAENERLDIIRDHTHNTLSRQKLGGNVPTIVKDNSLAATRKKQIRPNTSFTDDSRAVSIQNSDEDAEELARGDRDLTIIESRRAEAEGRLFCTLQRGDYEACFQKAKRTRQYLIAVDLSPQAKYAIEWAIGTVVRDGDTVRIVHVLDLDDKEDRRSEAQQAEQRGASMDDILVDLKRFLMRTKLEVRCEVEVIHHVAPKHLITEIIDTMDPTLVVIGSRGLGNMTGILLGSFSNYIINKSSAPVMVARKRLRRGGSKKRKIVLPTTMRMVNNRFETAVVD